MTDSNSTARPLGVLRRGLALSTFEGMVAELVAALAGGGVLTAWALHLRCSPIVVALVGAMPFVAQLVQLPSAWLTQLRGSRRVALLAVAASRQAVLPLAVVPFVPWSLHAKRVVLLAVTTLTGLLGVAGNNAWTAWMGDLVPASLRGRYFGRRTSLALLAGSIGALAGGIGLDAARQHGSEELALAALSALGFLAGLLTTALMARQPPAFAQVSRPEPGSMLAPLRDARARPLLLYQLAWNSAVGVAASFFAVFMLRDLHLGFGWVAAHGAAMALVRVLTSGAWGRAIDRLGARPVLVVCSFGLFALPLLWLAPTTEHVLWPLALDVVLAGLFWGGHGLASFELPLSLAEPELRPFYVAAFATAAGVSFAGASLLGGWLATALPPQLWIAGVPLHRLQVLFVLSAIGRLLAAPLATRLHEDGAAPVQAFFGHLRRRFWLARG
ncbi:MAG: MFS transporter [Deltaproteobacteria bacterium]|nr:MFS transporter [Deltaproteobacteria bacterium]